MRWPVYLGVLVNGRYNIKGFCRYFCGPWAHFLFLGLLMRRIPQNIQVLIEPVVASLGYELLGIEYLMQGKHTLLRIYIDSGEGITLDDCTQVSHQVSGLLDVEDIVKGQFNLEVSSPGLDRPLFTLEQFQRYIGSNIKVRLSMPVENRRKCVGRLCAVDEKDIVLDIDGVELHLNFDNIEKANIVPDI